MELLFNDPTIQQHTKTAIYASAAAFFAMTILYMVMGFKRGLTKGEMLFSTTIFSILLAAQITVTVYGNYCSTIGPKENNNCLVFSQVEAYAYTFYVIVSVLMLSAVVLASKKLPVRK